MHEAVEYLICTVLIGTGATVVMDRQLYSGVSGVGPASTL